LKIIEVCLPAGNPVLIENIDESLDPSLEPLLTKDVRKVNGQDSIKLGDTWVAISSDFKFMVTTKLSNPHYLPEVCIKVTLINFTVTPSGLEDQLLVDVIKFEQPELE
jgi:dynein heavy chain